MNQSSDTLFHHNSTIPPWHWEDGPNTRGTWDIISSCVITLCLCLWTALHLNIPEHRGSTNQRWRKLGWLFIGLLAPEVVVFTALEQRRRAIAFTREMRTHFGGEQASEWPMLLRWLQPKKTIPTPSDSALGERQSDRRHPWTHVHSFYALMGGFAYDTANAPAKFLPNGTTRLTIRLEGLRYIVEYAPALIPDISEEHIRDKSKADGLAKVLVCLQALWFCVQCLVRVTQSQDISFLELNTFAHAVCALLTYALWWHKPLDIESPTLLTAEPAWEMCALMYVTTNGESTWDYWFSRYLFRRNFSLYTENYLETELSRGQRYEDRAIAQWTDLFNGRHLARLREHQSQPRAILRWDPALTSADGNSGHALKARHIRYPCEPSEPVQVRKGDSVFGFCCIDVYSQADWCRAFPVWKNALAPTKGKKDYRHRPLESQGRHKEDKYQRRVMASQVECQDSSSRECIFDQVDLNRWALVSRAWQRYQPTPQQHDPFAITSSTSQLRDGIGRRSKNLPRASSDFFSVFSGNMAFDMGFLTFAIATALYGGLHLLAWNSLFGSDAERFLWRASGILLAMSGCILILSIAIGLAIVVMSLIFSRIDRLYEESASWLSTGLMILLLLGHVTTIYLPLNLTVVCYALAYIPARAFLIIESCIQLARLPPGAYETPDWSKYYPHIS